MKLTFNAETILDLVLDEILGQEQLKEIANQLYADRRGGELADLWASDEFIHSLQEQISLYK